MRERMPGKRYQRRRSHLQDQPRRVHQLRQLRAGMPERRYHRGIRSDGAGMQFPRAYEPVSCTGDRLAH